MSSFSAPCVASCTARAEVCVASDTTRTALAHSLLALVPREARLVEARDEPGRDDESCGEVGVGGQAWLC